jgi:tetratricopeptide (TPR) repeat protein
LSCGITGKKKALSLSDLEPDPFAQYKAYDHFVKGDLYEQSGNLDAAAEEYRKALIFDPGSLEIRRILSEVYFEQRKFDEAAILRSEIAEKSAEDYNFIADCLRYNKDLESAASFYRRSLELDSTQYLTRIYLARIYQFLGRNDEAETEYRKLLRSAPNKVDVFLDLADFYLKTDNLGQALDSYANAATLDSLDMRPLVGMAAIYLANADSLRADSLYFAIAQRNWDNPDVLNSLIVSFYNVRDYEKAEILARRIAEISPDTPGALKRYAMILFSNEKMAEAESLLTLIEQRGEGDALVYYYLARIKQEKADYPAAEEFLKSSLAFSDTMIDTWISLAMVINRQDRYNDALHVMSQALNTIPQDSSAILFFTSVIHSQNNQFALARDGYLRLRDSDPDNIGIRFNLASAYERLGEFDVAEREFEWIIEKDPDNALALNYLGYMYADKGMKLHKAKELIERALTIEPDNVAFLDSYAWVFYRLGRYDEALRQMKKAMQGDANDPVIFDHQGDIYLALNEEDLAHQSWAKALELKPDDETIRAKLNAK